MEDPHALAKYVSVLAAKLRLHHWDIVISSKPCAKEQNATITTIYGRQIAEIRVNKKWDTFSNIEKRQSLVHELIHLHMDELGSLTTDDLQGALDEQAYLIYKNMFRRQLEKTVDRLADLMAPILPLLEIIPTTEEDQAVATGNAA